MDTTVQHNGKSLLHIGFRDLFKEASPFLVKVHGNIRLTELRVDLNPRIRQVLTREEAPLLDQKRNFCTTPCDFVFVGLIEDFSTGWNASLEGFLHIMFLIHQLELKKGCLSDEVNGPLRVANTRELDEYSVFALATYVRFADAELVNPVADGFHGLLGGHFLDILHFFLR